MGVEAAMGQADLFHDLGDARAVVPSSPSSARGGRDDPFVGDFLAAGGGPPGGDSAHMMIIIYQSGAERKRPTPGLIGRRGLRWLPSVGAGCRCLKCRALPRETAPITAPRLRPDQRGPPWAR